MADGAWARKTLFLESTVFTKRSLAAMVLLAVLPNLLGMVVLDTGLGFKLHVFQYLIFVSAFIFGPMGGALSGLFGSVWTAAVLNNPYIMVGNLILGFFFGYFVKHKVRALPAVLAAFAIQLPWLVSTDIFLAGMPMPAVQGVVIALLVSNMVWAFAAGRTWKGIAKAAGLGS